MNVEFLFETSWEVCNKVGGIHTVISTKALKIVQEIGDNYILIGPDVWREDVTNPEFMPDDTIYSDWRQKAISDGLRVKTGRWNIAGRPIVVLIDFTPYFGQQNDIFAKFWETYKLDSISGQWDYIEPALFGYAAGKVIESFTNFYREHHNIVAQFHEWMTGTGILYLKKYAPWVASAFTTHATALGRCIAGNNRPLYGKMESYNPVQIAREFNIVAKQSLEKLSAQEADVFTTVSEITSRECHHFLGKDVNVITPNGFEDSFVPPPERFEEVRRNARAKLRTVAEALLGHSLSEDALFLVTSGRYEFRNKGIDVFINALGELQRDPRVSRECVAFFLVPAYHKGPRQDLIDILAGKCPSNTGDKYLTHNLHYPLSDPVLQKIAVNNLANSSDSKVKIIFVPCYLNGNDGIFNLPYFDLVIGFDLSVFPSYYEPWGYTPLESLMFSIPTITTSLSGFGLWVRNYYENPGNGIAVIERTDDNEAEVISEIRDVIVRFTNLNNDDVALARSTAHSISRIAMWDTLVAHYFNAYATALAYSAERREEPREFLTFIESAGIQLRKPHQIPVWKDIYVQSDVPGKLASLNELANNLWWSWTSEAENLFKSMDPSLWEEVKHNPKLLLEKIDYKRLLVLEDDEEFVSELTRVYGLFRAYIDRPDNKDIPSVAYFSMEFGIHPCLKIYSGGLGILAGDYLKEASDSDFNITGVGLLYRYGYFTQKLGPKGEQLSVYEAEDFSRLPIIPVKDQDGNHLMISLIWPGRTVKVRVWEAHIGKVRLVLLDTDFEENDPEDRTVTHYLYGGDNENRLRQELVLGIGGIRALEAMGIHPDVYHSNEGHSAFISLERLRILINDNHLTFNQALEAIRASTLFTTHTPVPAGHDAFDEDLLRKYISHYHSRLSISWNELMALGQCEGDADKKFNMSYLATRMSQEVNGVSKLHGQVSQGMFNKLWPGYLREELFIGYVTNGVHHPTWTAPEWREVYKELTGDLNFDQTDRTLWEKLYTIDDRRIYDIKKGLKHNLFTNIRKRIQTDMIDKHVSPRTLLNISSHLDEKALTIGFARRFATYKRAYLLFRDLDRLSRIVNNPEKPVQFIYAGKAHPNDGGGKDLIRRIFEVSQMPQFAGKVIFLENYDIELAKYLTRGVDIWLNTPTRPLEASGTSGEKAVMNGTIHFSVLDGWWVEGYRAFAGWALPKKRTFENQDLQDDIDAETIYNMLEYEIVPAYYSFDDSGIPVEWVSLVKNTMVKIAPEFTMKRQIDDYYEKYYNKLSARHKDLTAEDFAKAKELAAWKQTMRENWDNIDVIRYSFEKASENVYRSGHDYKAEIVLDIKNIPKENVGVEFIITRMGKRGQHEFVDSEEFRMVSCKGGKCLYRARLVPEKAGSFFYGIRIYPKHKDLPHRQDFYLLRWID
ncbi:MAG TPA: alpha-glucan family phosphorylase [Bacteroidales bacterium]|jgi:phosphorylase/glycogen(starch) synthase|nr:alpha-glucan family phosphorylase [Bacteroidales bacterium]